jgi:hypothetical protein
MEKLLLEDSFIIKNYAESIDDIARVPHPRNW